MNLTNTYNWEHKIIEKLCSQFGAKLRIELFQFNKSIFNSREGSLKGRENVKISFSVASYNEIFIKTDLLML